MIGFMQGRLSPKPTDRIQAFPKDSWREEFERAREIGFDCIEVIYDDLYFDENPLTTAEGRREMLALSKKTGVKVRSICSDYFMIHKLADPTPLKRDKNLAHALKVLELSVEVDCPLVEFPFVDSSSLLSKEAQDAVLPALKAIAEKAKALHLRVAIETDLPPLPFRDYLAKLPSNVGANLDLGNSAALGYDPLEECRAYGDRIFNVHIKDRVRGGTTVAVGTGNTDFKRAFQGLKEARYKGDFILQTAPDPDYLGVAKKYLGLVKEWSTSLREAP